MGLEKNNDSEEVQTKSKKGGAAITLKQKRVLPQPTSKPLPASVLLPKEGQPKSPVTKFPTKASSESDESDNEKKPPALQTSSSARRSSATRKEAVGSSSIINQQHLLSAASNQTGRFTIFRQEVLGSGGFGTVFKGFDNIAGSYVAIKECHIGRGSTAQQSSNDELLSEFALMTKLKHKNIVTVLDFSIVDGDARLVMELMHSGSVDTILKSRGFRLHEAAVRRYARESLEGLAFLHANGVLHRDIKPGNMLVGGNGEVKLSDFGTSRVQQSSSTTQHLVGTVMYMSPDAIRGKFSKAVDMWAWACSVREMLTATPPWDHLPVDIQRNNIPLMFHIGSAQEPDHAPILPDHCTTDLRDIMNECFSLDPQRRPSADDLLQRKYFAEDVCLEKMEPVAVLEQLAAASRSSLAGVTGKSTSLSNSTSTGGSKSNEDSFIAVNTASSVGLGRVPPPKPSTPVMTTTLSNVAPMTSKRKK